MILRFFYFIIFFFLLPLFSLSQDWTMSVNGRVFVGGVKQSGAIITLYRDNKQIQQIITQSNGRFNFELPSNSEYIIAITKPGFITKNLKVSTKNVPPDRASAGNFNPFEPDVTLFEIPTSPEIAKRVEVILNQPLAIYQFIPREENFNYDEKYNESIQNKLAELTRLQKEAEKGMEEKAKQAALEAQKQKATDEKYKAAITKADDSFNSKDYASAKKSYTEASGIKPAEQYPKTKLSEIENLLAGASKQKSADEKYKAAITKADGSFNSKDYASAKISYTEASGIKPTEQYPKTKVLEIEKIFSDIASKQSAIQKKNDKYDAAIILGDFSLKENNIANAKLAYNEALTYKPNEKYPKDKLAEIEKIEKTKMQNQIEKEIIVKYNNAIDKGDRAFASKNYPVAKTSYQDALSYKPDEKYPKNKIRQIDDIEKNKLLATNTVEQKKFSVLEKEKMSKYQLDLRNKYSPGITEEEYNEGRKTILRRIVIKDNFAGVYIKVIHSWGGIYFFKDGAPITETSFENETK
ncbi:MAG: hypothetical protein V1781_00010 [Bacteroidota bacterium]